MENEEIEKIFGDIKKTIGDEKYAQVSDKLNDIQAGNTLLNETIKNKDTEIKVLKNDKDLIMKANANILLQKQTVENENQNVHKEEPKEEKIKISDFIDIKGNFKNV